MCESPRVDPKSYLNVWESVLHTLVYDKSVQEKHSADIFWLFVCEDIGKSEMLQTNTVHQ